MPGSEGNHGEDVKEYYCYLDSTPTHSYMKMLYKYPQVGYPCGQLVEENRRRVARRPSSSWWMHCATSSLGRVGLTEKEAQAQVLDYRVAKIAMSWVVRALETDETRGLMKAIVDAETDQILGAAILGVGGGEVMAVPQMAMMGGVPYATIRDGVFAHPTLAEALSNLFMAMES